MYEQLWFQKHNTLTLIFVVTTGSLIFLCSFELLLFMFLRLPLLNNYFPYFKSTIISVYFSSDRNILQFSNDCTQYDPELTYTLKPGEFDFCNREYCNHYSVNRLGVRDDEASLLQPETIVLGDSYALGWGVNQDETFAELLEKQSGTKVLNGGVSSYGTARELLLLRRLDTSRLKTIVLQYSNNDIEENTEFEKNNRRLNIRSEENYLAECKRYSNRNRYNPFLYTSTFLKVNIKDRFFKKIPSDTLLKSSASLSFSSNSLIKTDNAVDEEANESKDAARIFLDILSNEDLNGIKIIVLNLSHYSLDTHSFIHNLSELKNSNYYPVFVKNIILIDASAFLEKEDYYIIDDHLNKSGHQKVANAVVNALRRSSK